jgi:signal transduction histidine kinase
MNKGEIATFLKGIALFKDIPSDAFDDIAGKFSVQEYSCGEKIFLENTVAESLYIIVNGTVDVLKKSLDSAVNEEFLIERGSGDFFGEMSIMDDLPRSATIRAKSETVKVLILKKEDFIQMCQTYTCLAYAVAKRISATVREANYRYVTILEERNHVLEKAYTQLKNTQEELLNAERLSAIGKFASIIIHDIKNPLTNIRAYAELLERKLGKIDGIDEFFFRGTSTIINEVDRLVAMTTELLDFSKGDSNLDKEEVDFYEYLQTIAESMQGRAEKNNIQIKFEPVKEKIFLFIDKQKMQRVFSNLVNNAIEAIGENGVINITLENKDDGFVLWKIKDSGCGIPQKIASRIFEPFVSGKSNGTGLGMSIVKSFVEKHGGSISVESKVGEGTEMIISLPKSGNV